MFTLASGVNQGLIVGTSGETKPLPIVGLIFLEIDTGNIYQANNTQWLNVTAATKERDSSTLLFPSLETMPPWINRPFR